MKVYIILLLLVLPAFLEATPKAWWGRRHHRQRQRPRPRPRPHVNRYGSYNHYASCTASGDPHYKTFDNKRYNFMGACNYVFVTDHCKSQCGRPHLGTFKVISENVKCGPRVSCATAVSVEIRGDKIRVQRGAYRQGTKEMKHLSVRKEGKYVVFRSKPAALVVRWDGNMGLHAYLSTAYKGKVCGLCGNYDGNGHNDFIKSDFKSAGNNVNLFANSWRSGGRCGSPPVVPKHPCEKKPHLRGVAEKDCSVIKSSHFQKCKAKGVDVDALYRNCLYDVCSEKTSSYDVPSCDAIKEASEECKDQGVTVTWGHLADKCKCQKKAN